MPDCKVMKNNGFTDDEIKALEQYLAMNKKQIIGASYRAAKCGMISKGNAVTFGIFHCFFVFDVVSAILLQNKLKKS